MLQCKICKSESLEHIVIEKRNENYYACEVCEFIFKDENEIITIEDEKEVYSHHENNFESEGYVKMFEDFLEKAVFPFVNTTGDALDYGCGPGPVLAKILENNDWNVKTYDPIFESDADYNMKTYDLITSTEVFEHFKNPIEEIGKVSELLSSGGLLSIMTLLRPSTTEEFKNWWYNRDKTHISFYSSKTLYLIGKMFDLEMVYNNNKRLIAFKKI